MRGPKTPSYQFVVVLKLQRPVEFSCCLDRSTFCDLSKIKYVVRSQHGPEIADSIFDFQAIVLNKLVDS